MRNALKIQEFRVKFKVHLNFTWLFHLKLPVKVNSGGEWSEGTERT